MLFCINTIHSGFAGGTIAFLLFCLPGAVGMYGLSVGIAHVGNTLPPPVYALLSGLNAATVGIIALAAVRLSERAVTDKLTRFLHKNFMGDFGSMTWKVGTGIIVFFLITFILTLTLHAVTARPSQSFSLFSSLYLAGTIIFGGGPVVIPLLREYIVTPGWVSPRDFLLGLAVIQAFPGPNFNFAVYLGSLAVAGTTVPSYLGALIAFVAMYAPGIFIVVGFTGLWRILRDRAWFRAILRGVNAAAVGLVFTAVYKLWQIGDLTAAVQSGSPLGSDPWLVAITGTAFVGGAWFKMNPPVAILLGGAMGVARYGVVNR
ncbi:chromate transporter, partial [Lecanoromycetidae sp. Uapishka_2]